MEPKPKFPAWTFANKPVMNVSQYVVAIKQGESSPLLSETKIDISYLL